uniref:NADH-ubiquinone oxidoreductase chain 6 n=1 Tax=Cucujoidea sp. 14 KM-2017 TaxID=2219350 RepID=A0A346RFK4_9CUCU|nr:NADH dehydrogenase subunit 6 [Cucujoidea sp. 14 KM-2017]
MLLFSIMFSSMFIFLTHPLSMGFCILIQTIFLSINMGMTTFNFWYSYILTLIMIGGLLILFIYMTSVASNEKFKFSMWMFLLFMLIYSLTMIYLYKMNMIESNYMMYNKLNDLFNFYNMNYMAMIKFYNLPTMKIMIITILYLLITLIAVVKISKTNSGPLRQMF